MLLQNGFSLCFITLNFMFFSSHDIPCLTDCLCSPCAVGAVGAMGASVDDVSVPLWVCSQAPEVSLGIEHAKDRWVWDQGELRTSGDPWGTPAPVCYHILSWLTSGSDSCCFTLVFHIPCKFLLWPSFSWNRTTKGILGNLIPAYLTWHSRMKHAVVLL